MIVLRSARRHLLTVGGLLALALVLAGIAPGARPAYGAVNLVTNPGLETLGPDGFPTCWQRAGWGTNTHTYAVTGRAHGGARAMALTMTARTSGDRKLIVRENAQCAPAVIAGHQYDLSVWYTTTTPSTVVTVFRHDATGWHYWTDLATLPVSAAYRQAEVRTPPIPAGTDQLSWGVTIYAVGTVVTDDYSMVDATAPPPPEECVAGAACTTGAWRVLDMQAPVRGIHAVVLRNGNVLLVGGSGNDPAAFAAGSFKTAVYNPTTGAFLDVPTPADLFCGGHVQLPDGRILIPGGTAAYAAPDGSHGYKGLASSYIFDPATNAYTRTNDMADGHWYPSATALGNGDVISLGGLGPDSDGTVVTEYWNNAEQRWLTRGQARQTWSFWGLYPSMILLQDGRLFYSGSHVFGNGLPGTGASLYDYPTGTITDVPGLQRKDERDQSMSVLLPPAQDQRVLTLGGGNIVTNPDANRLTDIIDLKQPAPAYTPGPLLPQGRMTNGALQTATQGKMYLSAVLLPDGTVLETGGGLHNRADPVFETSIFDPATNTFKAGMATDPVPRGYHSTAFLLPDGRVMTTGNNPGDGSFDQRVSIYSPPYLYQGARPVVTAVQNQNWGYGTAQRVTVDSAVVKASLIRPAAVTHSSDPNQRYVDLPMTVGAGGAIDLNLTTNPNIAPPGWYMLFVTNAAGVPSVAKWVHVG